MIGAEQPCWQKFTDGDLEYRAVVVKVIGFELWATCIEERLPDSGGRGGHWNWVGLPFAFGTSPFALCKTKQEAVDMAISTLRERGVTVRGDPSVWLDGLPAGAGHD